MARPVAQTKRDLMLLFERPTEPCFMPKGQGADRVIFEVPDVYKGDRYKAPGVISSRFGEEAGVEIVPVQTITLPDITFAKQLGRQEQFSLFLPLHRQLASRLISIFMGMRNLEELKSSAVFCRDNLNPMLFNYAYSVALLHRQDTRDIAPPSLAEVFPAQFIGAGTMGRVQEELNVINDADRMPIEIPYDFTGNDLDEEHRLAYFREDLGVNLHHWHWHLVYPNDAAREVVNKDRRGELFYYMHQQLLARYNLERFSNQLPRTRRMTSFRELIPEGYFPKLDTLLSNRNWPSRQRNTFLSDVNREVDQIQFDLSDLERWRERFYQAIHAGAVINAQGQSVPLTETGGIDILGNMMEASILTVNRNLYGDLHNLCHIAIAGIHDPDNRHLEGWSVMFESSTAMRDPIFYPLHGMIDDIFQEHKQTLPRYTSQQLDYSGVRVTAVEVNALVEGAVPNVLTTFWKQDDVEISRGLDFFPRGPVYVRFTHLDHNPFQYRVTVENSGQARQGTVRIFLAPRMNERGTPMLLRDQRTLFIEMDRFAVNLTPGRNTIERHSSESTITIPFERTFRNLDANRPAAGTAEAAQFDICGCGWPDHMLLPKGNAEGLQCQLFVMVSDYAGDRVDQDLSTVQCGDASSFCGIRDRRYPDRRSMGYPFDRVPRDGAESLAQFLTPNMRVQDISIRFRNRMTVPPMIPAGQRPTAPGQRLPPVQGQRPPGQGQRPPAQGQPQGQRPPQGQRQPQGQPRPRQ